jgi:DNA invertase Pin-like site-specific DNA recombinase
MDPAMDTSTPAGRLVFNALASIAQFKREIMLTRQRQGIAKVKAEGKYKGRAPTAWAKADEVRKLLAEGVRAAETARRLGIGRRSEYRILEDNRSPATGDDARALAQQFPI